MKKRKKKSRTPPNMKKRKRKTGRPPKIKRREPPLPNFGKELLPLDPEEFSQAFALAMKAAREGVHPELPGVKLLQEDGSVSESQFKNTAHERLIASVLAYYKTRSPEALRALVRVNAVMKLAQSGALGHWGRPNPDTPESQLHPAVLEAAATTRLTKAATFLLPEFLREVRRIASEKYPEGDAW